MAVTSHGNKDVIISSDGQYVKIAELRKIVDETKAYNGKPKLFLIDACQGDFKAQAMHGFGSYFLQAVAYIFSRYAYTEEITEMTRKVNHLVSLSGCQMPEYTSSLRKKLYFFPGLSE
nr:hypothetical protein BaRGS_031541 [Batillaria attramentaria]